MNTDTDRDPEKNSPEEETAITPAKVAAPAAPAAAPKALQRELSTDTTPINYFKSLRGFEIGQRQAMMLSRTSVLPNAYRHEYQEKQNGVMVWVQNPDAVGNCFVALEMSARLGLSPIALMQNMDVIHGRPGLRGTLLIALINSCGLFSRLRFVCNHLEGDAYGWHAEATELSTGDKLVGPTITWAMVKGEKWQEKTGSKWNTMRDLMFQYRAASFWSRLYSSDVTMGLYTDDELRDIHGPELAGPQALTPSSVPALEHDGAAPGSLAELEQRLAGTVVDPPRAPIETADAAAEGGETTTPATAAAEATATDTAEAVVIRDGKPVDPTPTGTEPDDLFRAE